MGIYQEYIDFMYSFTIHESRNLKQARPKGQYVDLLRTGALTTPSNAKNYTIHSMLCQDVLKKYNKSLES